MKGKDQSFLTPEEINDAMPASIMDSQSVDLIMEKIDEARIFVKTPQKRAALPDQQSPDTAAQNRRWKQLLRHRALW